MRNHLIIISLMLISLLLSACSKTESPKEISNISPVSTTEVIEEISMQTTKSEPSTTEKSTANVTVSNEENKKTYQLLQ